MGAARVLVAKAWPLSANLSNCWAHRTKFQIRSQDLELPAAQPYDIQEDIPVRHKGKDGDAGLQSP